MRDVFSFFDSPELWKSVAFCLSVLVIVFPIYRILLKVVKKRAQQISLRWEQALKLRKEAENLLWDIQRKNFYRENNRKNVVQEALKSARFLKEEAHKEQAIRLNQKKREILERVHNIRQTGLTNLKEKVVNIAVATTADVFIHSEKIAVSEKYVEAGLKDLEWILEQNEEKNRLLQAIQNN